jgi:RNA polymerase sigma factor (sigma-70 family)
MSVAHLGAVLRRLLLVAERTGEGQTDRQLLDYFVTTKDEAAFAALLARHGCLVFGVCRSVLHQEQDAEDAFQATFLALARMASSIRKRDSLASWLYGVALRTALRSRQAINARRRIEPRASTRTPEQPVSEATLRELQAILHEEVGRLAQRYRSPFVLCCLEGRTRAEAAQELGWKEGTVSSRIAKARTLLESRLVRRGVTLKAALAAATLLPAVGSAAVPMALSTMLICGAVAFAAGNVSEGISAKAVALAEGVVKMMWYCKVKTALILLLAVIVIGSGFGWAMHHALAGGGAELAQVEQKPKAESPSDPVKEGKYFIFTVETDLQRELVPAKIDVFVVVDTTAALEDGKVALRELKLPELRKELLAHKKAGANLHFALFFKRSNADDADHQNVLRYALIGFGHETGFARVTAYSYYHNTDTSWKDFSATLAAKPRQAKGDESTTANDFVKTYPVRTALSRFLTSDADCAVVILPSLEKDKGAIPQKVRAAIIDAVGKLKLPHQKRASFYLSHIDVKNDVRQQLLKDFHNLANDMKFETSSVSFR